LGKPALSAVDAKRKEAQQRAAKEKRQARGFGFSASGFYFWENRPWVLGAEAVDAMQRGSKEQPKRKSKGVWL
jgi:hypothetical protein